ncbi:hypothetical protein L204_102018 [Cryptococcus depauperatus]|nr:hypothetical protein L204_05671 [Cryptococcus depauperatus CBS 7855]
MALVVHAIHTFIAEHGDELNFEAGDKIQVIEKDEAFGDGWWRGRNVRGEEGLFPATYISELPPSPLEPKTGHNKSVGDKTGTVGTANATASLTPSSMDETKDFIKEASVDGLSLVAPGESTQYAVGVDSADTAVTKSSDSNGINRTIGDIQDAIESIAARPESDDEQELGIGQDARAKLVEQARLANEQREKDQGGFVYSDESEDDDEDFKRENLSLPTRGKITGSPVANGFVVVNQAPKASNRVIKESDPVASLAVPVTAPSNATDAAIHLSADASGSHSVATPQEPFPPQNDAPGSLGPAFFPNTPPLPQSNSQPAQPTAPSLTSNRSSDNSAKPPSTWNVDDVISWLRAKGFEESIRDKFKEHEISGDILLELDANLLKELDIPAFGKRMRIAAAISELRRPSSMVSSSSQQISPSGLPSGYNSSISTRGMSAPPSTLGGPFPSTPPLSTPPTSANSEELYGAWAHGRKSSGHVGAPPPMEAIKENQAQAQAKSSQLFSQPPSQPLAKRSSQPTNNTARSSSTRASSNTATSTPVSPVTPSSTVTKRGSSGSMGHKRGKASVDGKDRLSFFGRTRKPAPANPVSPAADGVRSSSRLGFGSNKVHQMQPASPQNNRVSSGAGPGVAATSAAVAAGAALKQIGNPDFTGYLKKKGERYGGWKNRYVVLKGPTLYILKSETADNLKDRIDLHNHRIMADENSSPGSYGFRLVGSGGEMSHFFSSTEQTTVRGWMKALLKATIARDYTKPVTSSCNIPTIPLAEAQALGPRPPSPATRDATQRASRRQNPNQLTPHDANILMSLDTSSNDKRRSQIVGLSGPSPGRPSRDLRRPSSHFSQATTRPASSRGSLMTNGGIMPVVSRTSGASRVPSNHSAPSHRSFPLQDPAVASEGQALLEWVNTYLPIIYPRATAFPQSFISGEVIFLLVKSLSNIEPNPPVPPMAFRPDPNGQPSLDGLFAMMDMLVDAGVPIDGVSINDVKQGSPTGIIRLLKDIRGWFENGQGTAR